MQDHEYHDGNMEADHMDEPETSDLTGLEVAVIGMAGRFPGAANIHEFWENLKNGVESITFFSDEQLAADGLDERVIHYPNFVKAVPLLDDIQYFDSLFFSYAPGEADVMDPQLRLYHECAWTALEDAGYYPDIYPGLIGVYTGANINNDWYNTVFRYSGVLSDQFDITSFNSNSAFSTRISYALNLRGPSFTLQTACSTSLVSIHLACQGLLNAECDMALAGGVSVTNLDLKGYLYQEGMITSPDGHCRAFAADAAGTIKGDGVGVVLLKRLEDALADRDHIYAVVKGSAINNDGTDKIGYTAPSVSGQADVIRAAHEIAEIEPESITYIEAHGTGTALGDPIEIKALTRAFNSQERQFCGIGSVKSNVGHLDNAAGVTGFIKTVLMLKHKYLPPTLHAETTHPGIDFENSPVYVNTRLREWSAQYPRRAGVSAFGVGGTNSHVVLEEAPQVVASSKPARVHQLLLLSARTQEALKRKVHDLEQYLRNSSDLNNDPGSQISNFANIADIAYTLAKGRKPFKHRQMAVITCDANAIDRNAIADALTPESGKSRTFFAQRQTPPVVFMFSGQGSQYVNMGRDLYLDEPVFRDALDRCFQILEPMMGFSLKDVLYPTGTRTEEQNREQVNRTEVAQPLLFSFEYALAQLLNSWGIEADAMIGHSIGEYTAAHLAGVFSLEDAIKLVVQRGKAMQAMEPGSMLSLPVTPTELESILTHHPDLDIAAVNTPGLCVVSGPGNAVDALEKEIKETGRQCTRLHTSHAFHSAMMDPMLEEFQAAVKQVQLNPPTKPFISNTTGIEITADQATDPVYWSNHVRRAVCFADGLDTLFKKDGAIFLEVGPGKALTTFVKQHDGRTPDHMAVNMVRHPKETVSDTFYLTDKIGHLWLYGVQPDWSAYFADEIRYRVPLPTYPFEPMAFKASLVELGPGTPAVELNAPLVKQEDISQWFYVPAWKSVPLSPGREEDCCESRRILVFHDHTGLGTLLQEQLELNGQDVIGVEKGTTFTKQPKQTDNSHSNMYTVNPARADDYLSLFRQLKTSNRMPDHILHLWSVTGDAYRETVVDQVDALQDLGFNSLLNITRALVTENITEPLHIDVISDNMQEVTGTETTAPGKSTLLGAVKGLPLEFPHIRLRSIDIVLPAQDNDNIVSTLVDQLLEETTPEEENTEEYTNRDGFPYSGDEIAYRGPKRWVKGFEAVSWPETQTSRPKSGVTIKDGGVYLVTGGLSGIGLVLAKHLAGTAGVRLVLTGRSQMPPQQEWDQWLTEHENSDPVSAKITGIRNLKQMGAEVSVFAADVADSQQMKTVVETAIKKFGTINGVIHSAGVPDGVIFQQRTAEMTAQVLAPKVTGTLILDQLFKDMELDFFMCCSSLAAVLAPFGQLAYTAANTFLDAYARHRVSSGYGFSVSVNWDAWKEVGMAVAAAERDVWQGRDVLGHALSPEEGTVVFQRVLTGTQPNVMVSTRDLVILGEQARQAQASTVAPDGDSGTGEPSGPTHKRPPLSTPYLAPQNDTQETLVSIWQELLGIDSIGINDDFFELGGGSLKGLSMIARIRAILKVEVTVTDIFNAPTVKTLAESIGGMVQQDFSAVEPAEKREFYPLAPAQKRLYLVQQISPDSTNYNMPLIMILEGEIDPNAFENYFRVLMARHESLRTSVAVVEGKPMQIIHDAETLPFRMDYHDVSTGEQGNGKVKAEELVNTFVRPFDLSEAPSFRVGIVKFAPKEYVLMMDFHHSISDAASHMVLLAELLALYNGETLAPLNIQFKDYAQWQHNRVLSGEMDRQKAYWLDLFREPVTPMALPTDFPRPSVRTNDGRLDQFRVPDEYAAKLRVLAEKEDVTMFMVMLTVTSILLAKLSHREDIVVGTLIAGRTDPELEKVVGMFVNTLVLRNFPGEEKTVIGFLREVKKRTLDAFDNQDYQFEDLVENVNFKREPGRNPLFDILFSFNSPNERDASAPPPESEPTEDEDTPLKVKGWPTEIDQVKFDMLITGRDTGKELVLVLEYSTELFKAETIRRYADYYNEIIAAVVEDENRTIKSISVSHDLLTAKSDVYNGVDSEFDF